MLRGFSANLRHQISRHQRAQSSKTNRQMHRRRWAPQTVICNDAGCSMNISGMCHRQKMPTQVKHVAELIAEAMGINIHGVVNPNRLIHLLSCHIRAP